jgi:hypothetical protein
LRVGRPKKTATTKLAETAAAIALANQLEGEGGEDEQDEEIFAALQALDSAGEVEWQVRKMDGPREERGFIERIPTGKLELQYFRDTYGPGEYEVRGFRDKKFFAGGYKRVQISKVGYRGPATPQVATSAAQQGAVADVLAVIKADREKQQDTMFRWGQLLIPLMAPVVANMFAPKNDLAEAVKALGALKGLQPEAPSPVDVEGQLDKVVSIMAKLREAAGEAGGESTGKTVWDLVETVVKSLAPALPQVAAALAAKSRGAVPMIPQPPGSPLVRLVPESGAVSTAAAATSPPPSATAPVAAAAAGGAHLNGNADMNMAQLLPWLKATMAYLVTKAAQKSSPDLYVEWLLDGNTPPELSAHALYEIVKRPHLWTELCSIVPEVAPYKPWFEEFFAGLQEALEDMLKVINPSGDAPAQPAPANGDDIPLSDE